MSQTINRLKEMGLVRQQLYGPVELTDNGRAVAIRIIQRHKILKWFLVETLGVDPGIAEEDACRMEHAVSSQTMDRLTDSCLKTDISKMKPEPASEPGRSSCPALKSGCPGFKTFVKSCVKKV